MRCLVNDLEPAAFALAPELGALQDRAASILGRAVRMSGSGSSLFSLFDHLSEAQSALERLAGLDVTCRCVELAPAMPDDLGLV